MSDGSTPTPVRLSKLMAERGLCSRREADELISRGWVLVDGSPVSVLGTKILPGQRITLAPAARASLQRSVTILLNKPLGYVSGQPEPGARPAVSLIVPANRFPGDRAPLKFSPVHLKQLAPAGRLDVNSQGLLVFTQDGRIARLLVGAEGRIEKEYLVRVEGRLTPEALERLRHGLSLDGKKLRPATVRRLDEGHLQMILREGRKRQIRRMCEAVGLAVTGLKRVRIGRVALGNLPSGQWRYLGPDERFD
ncbi:MAG: pseudouridine synthase [candidate division FCPU426 bacterium]